MSEQPARGDEAVERMERAATAIDPVMGGVKPEDLEKPTVCRGWNVGKVVTHLLSGLNERLASASDGPASGDAQPDDVPQAWRTTKERILAGLREPGALDREVRGPGGMVPLRTLVQILPIELMLHGWDIGTAIGASTDFDPEMAEQLLESGRPLLERFGRGEAFGPEQPAPAGATAMDRLAAFYGRPIPS